MVVAGSLGGFMQNGQNTTVPNPLINLELGPILEQIMTRDTDSKAENKAEPKNVANLSASPTAAVQASSSPSQGESSVRPSSGDIINSNRDKPNDLADRTEKIDAAVALGKSFMGSGQLKSAEASFQKALSLMGEEDQSGPTLERISIRSDMAVVLHYQGKYDEAIAGLQTLQTKISRVLSAEGTGLVINQRKRWTTLDDQLERWVAVSLIYNGEYTKAIEKLYKLFENIKSQRNDSAFAFMIDIFQDLALASALLGRYIDAREFMDMAVKYLEEHRQADRKEWRVARPKPGTVLVTQADGEAWRADRAKYGAVLLTQTDGKEWRVVRAISGPWEGRRMARAKSGAVLPSRADGGKMACGTGQVRGRPSDAGLPGHAHRRLRQGLGMDQGLR